MMPNVMFPGQVEGPNNWKRAVYRPAPSRFTVEMLPPIKLGGNHNFHMRICPIVRGDRSSVSSRSSNSEYEILRRWEDCLIFQDTLEREYARLATSKRQRLKAGKGVRKNGVYLHSDRASSWDSLPPGPEPDSVAQDLHDLIPRLTKKGTMFRASQATTDQRQAEMSAFVEALWRDDVPTLLEEFRRDRTLHVTRRARAHSSASSDSSSALSSASARSSIGSVQITLDDEPIAFGHNPHQGSDTLEPLPDSSEIARKGSRGAFCPPSQSVFVEPPADEAARRDRRSFEEQPARPDSRASNAATINRNPYRESWQTTASGMTFVNDLNLTLPDDDDDERRSSRMSMASIATFRTEVSSEGVMGVMPRYYIPDPNPARLSTASFMTDVSADAIIPRSPRRPDSRSQRTLSIASDDESVLDQHFYDAFPRPCSFIPPAAQQSRPATPVNSGKPRQKQSFSASTTTLNESPRSLPKVSLDPSQMPFPPHLPSPPASPTISEFKRSKSPSLSIVTPDSPRTPVYPRREFLRSPSPNGSVMSTSMSIMSEQSSFSDSTGSTITPSIYSFYSARSTLSSTTTATSVTAASSASSSSSLVIKAAHNNTIILLKAEADLSLREVRHRLCEKFLAQEGISLSDKFALAYMIPASPSGNFKAGRNRSNSLSSTSALSEAALMEKIATEEDWARLTSSLDGAKVTLRILDSSRLA
ncbi:hypothetical protein R3P38DRAFT_2921715 [Favolaschia claudopus]|uniref:PX domain-containing protein n=1 Tax=Favolaschia claudopus TaxID=2862362 RepID=A0AAW0C2H5_9AGAR